MLDWIISIFSNIEANSLASGLIASTLIGGVFYVTKALPKKIFMFVLDMVTITLTVTQENNYTAYDTFEQELHNNKIHYLTGRFHLIYRYLQKTLNVGVGEDAYFITRLGKKWALVRKYTDTQVSFWHSYLYTVRFFTRDKSHIEQFFKLIFENQNTLSEGDTIKVYQYVKGNWDYSEKQKVDCPVLLTKEREQVRCRIAYFLNNKASYLQKRRPYREGFILSGDPGCGKSYFIYQMASIFDLNIYYVNLRSFESDANFIQAMLQISLPSIILIEDIDCNESTLTRDKSKNVKEILKELQDNQEKEVLSGVSLSTILNTFDGLLSQDGQMIFITTNHLDKLDPALVRAGRFNTNLVFRKLQNSEINNYINLQYNKKNFIDFKDLKLSIAELAEVCDNRSYDEVINLLQTYV